MKIIICVLSVIATVSAGVINGLTGSTYNYNLPATVLNSGGLSHDCYTPYSHGHNHGGHILGVLPQQSYSTAQVYNGLSTYGSNLQFLQTQSAPLTSYTSAGHYSPLQFLHAEPHFNYLPSTEIPSLSFLQQGSVVPAPIIKFIQEPSVSLVPGDHQSEIKTLRIVQPNVPGVRTIRIIKESAPSHQHSFENRQVKTIRIIHEKSSSSLPSNDEQTARITPEPTAPQSVENQSFSPTSSNVHQAHPVSHHHKSNSQTHEPNTNRFEGAAQLPALSDYQQQQNPSGYRYNSPQPQNRYFKKSR